MNEIVVSIIVYIITESILSILLKAPLWVTKQSWYWLREYLHLLSVITINDHKENKFAKWNPRYGFYEALEAIRVTKSHSSIGKLTLDYLEEKIKLGETLLISGNPGAGKTTLLEALTYRLARKAFIVISIVGSLWLMTALLLSFFFPYAALLVILCLPVMIRGLSFWQTPIFISLRTYEGQGIDEFLRISVKSVIGDEALLKVKKRLVFLLDGVNEIRNADYGSFLFNWQDYDLKSSVVFSSRTGEEPWKEKRNFEYTPLDECLEITDLDNQGVKKYIEVYLKDKEVEEKYSELPRHKLEKITRNIRHRGFEHAIEKKFIELSDFDLLAPGGIGRNPYWLRMLSKNELQSRNKGKVFRLFIRNLLDRETDPRLEVRKRKIEWKNIVSIDIEMDALSRLAFRMQQEGVIRLQKDRGWKSGLKSLSDTLLSSNNITPLDILCEAEAATLINWKYKEYIEFTHPLLRDFFIANLLRKDEYVCHAVELVSDTNNFMLLSFLGGLLEDSNDLEIFINKILKLKNNLDEIIVLVGLLALSEKNNLLSLHDTILTSLSLSLTEPPTPKQEYALRQMLLCFGEQTIDIITEMLNGENYLRKITGLSIIRPIIFPEKAHLLSPALKDKDWLVRLTAICIIGDMVSLPQNSVQDEDFLISSLLFALKDRESYIQEMAADYLGYCKYPTVINLLLSMMDDTSVQDVSALALIRIGKSATEQIIKSIKNQKRKARTLLFAVLGLVSDPQSNSILLEVFKSGTPLERRIAAWGLGNIGDLLSIGVLIEALGNENSFVKAAIAYSLGKYQESIEVIEPLTKLMGDRNLKVKFSCR